MLGRMANDTGRYGTPTAFLEGDFEPQALAGAISRLPTVYSEAQRQQFSPSPEKSEDVEAVGEVKDGGLTERNGEIFVRRGNALEALRSLLRLRRGFEACSTFEMPSARYFDHNSPTSG